MLYKFALLAAFLFLTTGLGFQLSKCAEATQVAVVQGDVVNLRSGPGWSSPGVPAHLVVGQVRRGERLPVVGKSGDWLQVRRADGQAAWIAGQLVRVEGNSLPLPSQPVGQVAVVQGSVVNLRGGAGLGYPVVGQALRGDSLLVVGRSGDWVQVRRADGGTAWIAGWLVRVEGESLPLSSQPVGQVAVVQGDVVNLRSGPGWSSPGVPAHLVVGQVRRGERLPVVGKSGDWVQVRRADGQAAWIAGQLVRVEGESLPLPSQPQPQPKPTEPKPGILQPPASPDQTEPLADKELNGVAMVRVDAVDVRSQPGNHYTAIAQATRGFKLPLVSQRRNWYQIRLPNGNLGWVESSAVEVDFEAIVPPSRGEDREKPVAPGTYGVRVSGNRVLITVESTAPMTYRAFRLTAPDRIVVDIDGFAEEQLPDRTLASPVVERIRTGIVDGQFRLVCDLKRGLSHTRYRTELSSNRRTLTIEIYAADSVMDNRVIVLDPGHGGRDPGAIGPTGLREKDVCLDIALEAARLLRQKGAQVILTRTSDQFVELARRAEIANQAGADVFVSIHNNANVDHSKHGISTYYWPYPDVAAPGQVAARQNLARALQDALVSELGRHDLGLYQARFAMLRATNMASALVEVAFISNFEEEELLADRDFRLRAAAAIAEGIIAYFRPD